MPDLTNSSPVEQIALVESLTFGVEIEATIPRGLLRIGGHGQGIEIPTLPGWKADRDPSIRVSVRGHEACEFVSPVLKGADGLRRLLADVTLIRAMGAKVNGSCGLHIHVGFDKNNAEAVAKLATLVANFEKAIYASTGTKARERGRWCGGLNRYGNAGTALQASQRNRYHVANFGTRLPTVEFRPFASTLNGVKIAGYVRLCLAIVERALTAKRVTNWTAKTPVETSPIHRSGEGETALTRLFYQIGWTKGRQKHTHGGLLGTGIPSIQRTKKELVRLARKYDAQA
ncbi:MAG: amidoligase family protein [Planctomycetes bacterium]|nr:amidoligase family protein [Planctomycetota bacterium]